jgi:NitT/TauT family transport system substrate-binding protein
MVVAGSASSRSTRAHWLASSGAFAALAGAGLRAPADAQTKSGLRVGAGNIEAHAEAYYARANGIFAQNGLDVEVQTLRNGAAIASAVTGGDLQIGVSSILQLAAGRGHGLPFVVIAPGAVHDGRIAHTTNLVVAANGPIVKPADLNGKIVAVNTLNGLDQIIVSTLVDKSGGDSSTVKFVEVPPAAAADAVLLGRVAAAQLEEPELSGAGDRVRRLGDGEDAIASRFVTTGWFTTLDWLAANKDAARRFSAAIFAAGTWAMQNPEKAGVVLQKALGLTLTRGTQVFATGRNIRELSPLLTTAVKYTVASPVSTGDLFWDGS